MMKFRNAMWALIAIFLITSCNTGKKKDLFRFVKASKSKLVFENTIVCVKMVPFAIRVFFKEICSVKGKRVMSVRANEFRQLLSGSSAG